MSPAHASLPLLLKTLRPPFLLLTLVCVLLGAATVSVSARPIDSGLFLLLLLTALLAHISVNTLNEYHDFRNGLDLVTQRTPFSGGSGTLPQHPALARTVLAIGLLSLAASTLLGIFIIWQYGMSLAPLGILGLLLVTTYTPWLNRQPLLCLIAPGLGFGFIMVCGTQFVLQGEYSSLGWQAALVPFFLVNNLLLLNQYPDIHADRKAGRFHFPIVYGPRAGNRVYLLFSLLAFSSIVVFRQTGAFPDSSLVALLPLPLSLYALSGAQRHQARIGQQPKYLAANVAATLLTPLLLALSFFSR